MSNKNSVNNGNNVTDQISSKRVLFKIIGSSLGWMLAIGVLSYFAYISINNPLGVLNEGLILFEKIMLVHIALYTVTNHISFIRNYLYNHNYSTFKFFGIGVKGIKLIVIALMVIPALFTFFLSFNKITSIDNPDNIAQRIDSLNGMSGFNPLALLGLNRNVNIFVNGANGSNSANGSNDIKKTSIKDFTRIEYSLDDEGYIVAKYRYVININPIQSEYDLRGSSFSSILMSDEGYSESNNGSAPNSESNSDGKIDTSKPDPSKVDPSQIAITSPQNNISINPINNIAPYYDWQSIYFVGLSSRNANINLSSNQFGATFDIYTFVSLQSYLASIFWAFVNIGCLLYIIRIMDKKSYE